MNISSAKTEIKPTFNKVTFNEFESQLAVYKDKLKDIDTIESLKKLIVSNFTDLVSLYINMGNYVEDASHNNQTEVDVIETYIVNYSVPEDFKTTIILHRDVFLELNKVKVLEKEQKEIAEYTTKDGRDVLIKQIMRYENKTQMNRIEWHYYINGEFDSIQNLDMRLFFPQELDSYLESNGFNIIHKFGGFEEEAFNDHSEKQIFVCQ